MNYLPSKKIFLIIGGTLVALGLVWVAAGKEIWENTKTNQKPIVIASETTSETQQDSDKDGVPDWEEILAGTNPNDPSSRPSRNQTTYEISKLNPSIEDVSPTQTLLEGVAELSKSRIESGDQNPYSFDEKTKDLLISDAVSVAKKLKEKKNPFTPNDVLIDERENLKDYLNAVARITLKHFPEKPTDQNYESEISVIYFLARDLKDAEDKKTTINTALEKIKGFEARYLATAEELKSIKTPPETKDIQLGFLNSFYNTALALEAISALGRDPIVGILGMQQYELEVAKSQELLIEVKKLTKKEGIVFEKNEPGYEAFQIVFDRLQS